MPKLISLFTPCHGILGLLCLLFIDSFPYFDAASSARSVDHSQFMREKTHLDDKKLDDDPDITNLIFIPLLATPFLTHHLLCVHGSQRNSWNLPFLVLGSVRKHIEEGKCLPCVLLLLIEQIMQEEVNRSHASYNHKEFSGTIPGKWTYLERSAAVMSKGVFLT